MKTDAVGRSRAISVKVDIDKSERDSSRDEMKDLGKNNKSVKDRPPNFNARAHVWSFHRPCIPLPPQQRRKQSDKNSHILSQVSPA